MGLRSRIRKILLPSSDAHNFFTPRAQSSRDPMHTRNNVHGTNGTPSWKLQRNETTIENDHLSQFPHMRNAT